MLVYCLKCILRLFIISELLCSAKFMGISIKAHIHDIFNPLLPPGVLCSDDIDKEYNGCSCYERFWHRYGMFNSCKISNNAKSSNLHASLPMVKVRSDDVC